MRYMLSLAACALLSTSAAANAQTGFSLGVGGGIVGSTESSLSDGRSGVVAMGSVTRSLVPLVGIGVEGDYFRRTGSQTVVGTGFVKVHIPVLSLSIKVGGGFGSGDPDGNGTISGGAGQIGVTYDITLPAIPVALTVFGNGFLAHGSSRNLQMADAGLAFTWK